MLDDEGLPFHEIDISRAGGLGALRAVSGAVTVPQVFIDGVRIGGAEDLERHLAVQKTETRANEAERSSANEAERSRANEAERSEPACDIDHPDYAA